MIALVIALFLPLKVPKKWVKKPLGEENEK